MSVEIVVPWLAGCRHREDAWRFISARHRHPVRLAPGTLPWVKALAVRPAIETSDAELVVVADADCWTDGLDQALDAVRDGAPWAIPHRLVYRLNEQATSAFKAGASFNLDDLTQPPYPGYPGGGFVVARRETLLDVPLDPLFVGWGQEDESWARALTTLAGAPWRGSASLIHLWHPPQQRENRVIGNGESWRRRRLYLKAATNPDAMRTLVREGDDVAIADLISQQCVIYRTSETATRDSYGRPRSTATATSTVWAVQQQRATEPDQGGEMSDAYWQAFFLPTEAIDSSDTVYDADLGTFEVVGEPWPVKRHTTGTVHHIEATMRRTSGPEGS